MMRIGVEGWSAWTPGCPERDRIREWLTADSPSWMDLEGEEDPVLENISPRQLRRCSRITRMGLRAAFDAVADSPYEEDEVRLVWITRHGEINVTIDLLEDLADGEMLMPMAFSNSVPNTPAGYYDIATDNTLPTRTVCGGYDSFHQGMLDAAGLLNDHPDCPVLVVQADGVLPDPLDRFRERTPVSFGMGLVLSARSGEELTCRRETAESSQKPAKPPGLKFLRWFLGDAASTIFECGQQAWVWQRHD